MVKSFFVGLGATIAFFWLLWGICNATWHASIGAKGNWWGLWDWISVAVCIAGLIWLIGKFFIAMGDSIRNEAKR